MKAEIVRLNTNKIKQKGSACWNLAVWLFSSNLFGFFPDHTLVVAENIYSYAPLNNLEWGKVQTNRQLILPASAASWDYVSWVGGQATHIFHIISLGIKFPLGFAFFSFAFAAAIGAGDGAGAVHLAFINFVPQSKYERQPE